MKSVEQYLKEISPLCRQQNFQPAIALLKQAVQKYPDNEVLLGLLASCYQQIGMLDQAQELYGSIVAINPQNYLAVHQQGLIDFQKGRWERALQLWENLLVHPDDFLTKYYAAVCYEQLGRTLDARKLTLEAITAVPAEHPIYPEILNFKEKLGE